MRKGFRNFKAKYTDLVVGIEIAVMIGLSLTAGWGISYYGIGV